MIMGEFSYDFGFLEQGQGKGGEGKDEKQRGGAKARNSCRTLLRKLAIPVTDCRHRSHPRIVPDYSVLVLVACVTNPVLGALACYLHRQAKHLSHKGETAKSDVYYKAVFGLSVVSIGSFLACVSLLTIRHLVLQFCVENIRRSKPGTDCFFRDDDHLERERLNLTRNDYCRRMLGFGSSGGHRFTNTSRFIDKTQPQS